MSEEALRQKVIDLLERMERVFQTEWRKTKLNLDPEMIEHFVDPKGSFLTPESSTATIPWPSRDELLLSYRSLRAEVFGADAATAATAASPASSSVATSSGSPVVPQASSVIPTTPGQVPRQTSRDIPKPQTSAQSLPSPFPGNKVPQQMPVQWPGPMTAPLSISPASALAFQQVAGSQPVKPPSVSAKAPAPMSPSGQTKPANTEPEHILQAKEKFGHLIEGVQYEIIRDFILADGANSGTGKPSVIIHTKHLIWLEFAFDYAEGKRILVKYPQRDAELIEFMKASGHSE